MHYFTVVNNVTSTFASCLGRFLHSSISKSNLLQKRTTFLKINWFSQPRHECSWRSVRQSFHFLVALSIWFEKCFLDYSVTITSAWNETLRQEWEEKDLYLAPVILGYLVTLTTSKRKWRHAILQRNEGRGKEKCMRDQPRFLQPSSFLFPIYSVSFLFLKTGYQ